jgi:GNAT superfamily N-acetyltransferase
MIRPARLEDLEGYRALCRALQPADPAPAPEAAAAAWAALLGNALCTVLVAEQDGILAASCTLVVVPNLTRGARPWAVIENVVTLATHRRRGLGRIVIKAALERAWAADCYKVMLATGSKQEGTLRFYAECGLVRGGKTYFEARR